ncbi:hypothetical protein ABZV67_06310 [Streptomyces sp. NPDC005065]|uniref:hypothetical protein n=1 Tax=unclassified Streptomyces TaxID=2593676 RepID=UPI0033B380FA
MIGGSLKPNEDIIGGLELFPSQPVLDHYRRLTEGIAEIPVSTFFVNSIVLTVEHQRHRAVRTRRHREPRTPR